MNVAILSGNLSRDPEVRYTPTGTAVTESTLCVTTRYRSQSGEQKERTAFVGIVIWGARGEAFAKHHRKGSKAFVHGEIITESWDDKTTGKKQSKTKVQVEEWEFAERKLADGAPTAPAPRPSPPGSRSPTAPVSSEWPALDDTTPPPANDDDVPF